MSEAIKSMNVPTIVGEPLGLRRPRWVNYLPALLPVVGAAGLVTARAKLGAGAVPGDGALVVLGLLCYIMAAAMHVTDFWAPIRLLQRLALWTASLGFFFNLSGWLVRWVAAGDRENWVRMTSQITGEYHAWWFFSYVPFANLYDLSVAFAMGAAFATLLIEHRPNARFVGALSLPLIALVLILAIFIGDTFIDLPPVLDSYWRPIHVGVASLSYGVALVSFAIAVMYLVKDGVKPEAMAVFAASFIVGGLILFSNSFSVGSLAYRLTPVINHDAGTMIVKPLRVALPGVGLWMTLSVLLLLTVTVCFVLYLYKRNERARRFGHLALRASLLTQAAGLGWLFYQIRAMRGVGPQVDPGQYRGLGEWLAGEEAARMPVEQLVQGAGNWMQQNGGSLALSVNANPVEVASLIAAFVLTLFVVLFGVGNERIRAGLPALEKLDSLVYKTVGVAFAGLAILLVTGAVWANESWGRYWGWDAKETGALVAWLAYAGYLHTRISHGWSGRRSAYFALVGFMLVIFTYLDVSYLLPGLHSYA